MCLCGAFMLEKVLLDAIDGFVANWGVGEAQRVSSAQLNKSLVSEYPHSFRGVVLLQTFIGIILLPIAGNACEHLGAIRMAVEARAIMLP
eukprot:4254906-Amphidinium_carterae.1